MTFASYDSCTAAAAAAAALAGIVCAFSIPPTKFYIDKIQQVYLGRRDRIEEIRTINVSEPKNVPIDENEKKSEPSNISDLKNVSIDENGKKIAPTNVFDPKNVSIDKNDDKSAPTNVFLAQKFK